MMTLFSKISGRAATISGVTRCSPLWLKNCLLRLS